MIIGITGKIGSGKTTLTWALRKNLICNVIDVDDISHELLHVQDRKIAELIFEDKELLKKIESIIHPYVMKRVEDEVKKNKFGNLIIEFPLIFSKKFVDLCDTTVMMVASDDTIKKRLLGRGYSENEISNRLKVYPIQWDYEFDHFINNDNEDIKYLDQEIKKLKENI